MKAKTVVDNTDGRAYTKAQFIEFYGEKKANKIFESAERREGAAPKGKAGTGKAKGPKTVVDNTDGKAYTKSQFIEFYGEKKADKIFESAARREEAAPKAKAKATAKAGTVKAKGPKTVVDNTDGIAYTKAQFTEFYGETKADKIFEAAARREEAAPKGKAKAKGKAGTGNGKGAKTVVDKTDGVAYTKAQFIEFYGEKKADKIFEAAARRGDEAPKSKAKAKAKAQVKANVEAKAPKTTSKIEVKPNTIVLVSTSAAFLKGHPTGVWLEELAAPYYKFKEAGFEVVVASPRGGPIPIDANSIKGDFFTAEAKKFMHDGDAFDAVAHSVRLTSIDWTAADIKAVFMCGGHGVEVDFVRSGILKKAIEVTYAADRVVAAVCHGPVCLAQCKKPDGSALVKGLKVTGFSNSEEAAVGLGDKCVWLIEDKFKELEAVYTAEADWSSNVAVDGKLVTGQNPQSSAACAEAVIKLCK